MLTFKTLSACLLKKVFFLAVIGDVTAVLLDLAKRIDLKLLDFSHRCLIQSLKRWIVYLSLNLTLDKNCSVLSHLLLDGR